MTIFSRLRPPALTGLWRHADFMKLWTGQAVSQFGSMVTRDALPLIGVLVLQASPLQMGLLSAAGFAPVLVIGLLAGVWVDRVRRRPILIGANLGRAVLVASIPLIAIFGQLSIWHLMLVAALTGMLSVFFDVAYQAYLPVLVRRDHVAEGNTKLGLTDSLAEIAVPGLTGLLVQIISAPLTLLFDAASYLFSAGALSFIRAPEPLPPPAGPHASLRRELAEGLRAVARDPLLRSLAAAWATLDFFGSFFGALYGLYALQVLELQPVVLGLLVAGGGVGALLGALLVGPFTRRVGLGPALTWSLFLLGAFGLLNPLAGGPFVVIVACLFTAQLCGDMFRVIFSINEISLRQSITPDRLLGRVSASVSFLLGGMTTLGLLAGGLLGEFVGIRPAIWLASSGVMLAWLWLAFSPVSKLRTAPVLAGD